MKTEMERLKAIEVAAMKVIKVRDARDEDEASDEDLYDALADLASALINEDSDEGWRTKRAAEAQEC